MIIKNFHQLAYNKQRKYALLLAESALKSIKTSTIIKNNVKLKNNILKIQNSSFNLNNFKNIYVIGFGKSSSSTAYEIKKILKNKIKKGIVIDTSYKKLKKIKVIKATHPLPSLINIKATKQIINLVKNLNKDDLVICLISGGGSALFESSILSLKKLIHVYKLLLKSGANIKEMNTIRKHISLVKGGQLSKIVYPATLISIIFSDVLGNDLNFIASGPTVRDRTTINDAKKIIKKYSLPKITLIETPKDNKYFSKNYNFLLLSNKIPIQEMFKASKKLGLTPRVYSLNVKGESRKVSFKLLNASKKGCLLAAGETTVIVKGNGKGGRNQELVLSLIEKLSKLKDICVISLASDGIDNTESAGAIIDEFSFKRSKQLHLDYKRYLNNNDSFNFFTKLNDHIFTGKTNSNVADLMIIVKI